MELKLGNKYMYTLGDEVHPKGIIIILKEKQINEWWIGKN